MRLHDPVHGRQACPEFIAFDQGVDQVSGRGYFRTVPSQNGGKLVTSPPPPQSLNGSGALVRRSGGRLPKRIVFGNLEDVVRKGRGRKEKEWTDCLQSDSVWPNRGMESDGIRGCNVGRRFMAA